MSLLPPELKVHSFRCPFCREHTSARQPSCTRCARPFNEELIRSTIRLQTKKRLEKKLLAHRNSMLWGIVWIAIGGFLATQLPFCLVTTFCILGGAVKAVRAFLRYQNTRDDLRDF